MVGVAINRIANVLEGLEGGGGRRKRKGEEGRRRKRKGEEEEGGGRGRRRKKGERRKKFGGKGGWKRKKVSLYFPSVSPYFFDILSHLLCSVFSFVLNFFFHSFCSFS